MIPSVSIYQTRAAKSLRSGGSIAYGQGGGQLTIYQNFWSPLSGEGGGEK